MDDRIYSTGKRKTAAARVWIKPGNGRFIVNGQKVDEYFEREVHRYVALQPVELVEMREKVDIWATVRGGGKSGQAGALRHGVTRALMKMNPELRPPLKKAGFVTRDARKVERKKYGQPKARKRFQFSKR